MLNKGQSKELHEIHEAKKLSFAKIPNSLSLEVPKASVASRASWGDV